jgi:protein-S-isoprenylcysteine O-methyltransferase Ste14
MIPHLFFHILVLLWSLSEVAILLVTHTRRSTGEVRDKGTLQILWPVIVGSITLGSWLAGANPFHLPEGPHWLPDLALFLLVAGLAVRWTAILQLGRAFSANVAIHATQTLRIVGLYRIVRHPSYTGLFLIFLAIGLDTRNPLGFAIIVIPPMAALIFRIHVEEQALRQAFGQQYESYSRSTKRLLPGIY